MKLKKLLPLASIAGVAAVVAPLVTSCGTKTYKYLFDEENPADEWKPDEQIAASTETTLYDNKAITFYLESVNKNKKILADDIVYYWRNKVKKEVPGYQDINEGTVKVKVGKLEPETGKVSFSYEVDLDVKTSPISSEQFKFYVEIQNFEYVMSCIGNYEDGYHWMAMPFVGSPLKPGKANTTAWPIIYNYLKSHHDWHITCSLKTLGTLGKETRITLNSKSSEGVLASVFDDEYVQSHLCFEYFYYLFNVAPGLEPVLE